MARLLKIENWARTYSFGPRKINFTSKSAEFNWKFNRLVYGGPRSTDQRKKMMTTIFHGPKMGLESHFFNTKFEWLFFLLPDIFFLSNPHRRIWISVGVSCSGHHMCFFCQITHFSVWKGERKKILRFKIHFWLVISHFGFWLFSVVRKYIIFLFFGVKNTAGARTVWREPI